MKKLLFLIASTCAALFASAHAVVIDLSKAAIAVDGTADTADIVVEGGYTVRITTYVGAATVMGGGEPEDGGGAGTGEKDSSGQKVSSESTGPGEKTENPPNAADLNTGTATSGNLYGAVPQFSVGGSLTSGSDGIGVNSNGDEGSGLDGRVSQEALFFQIIDTATGDALDVEFTSITLSGSGSDVGVFAGSTVDDLDWVFNGGFDDDGLVDFAGGEVVASALMIAALGQGDSFFVQSISFDPIPVPGALPLMAAGLGAFGFARKKSRS